MIASVATVLKLIGFSVCFAIVEFSANPCTGKIDLGGKSTRFFEVTHHAETRE